MKVRRGRDRLEDAAQDVGQEPDEGQCPGSQRHMQPGPWECPIMSPKKRPGWQTMRTTVNV